MAKKKKFLLFGFKLACVGWPRINPNPGGLVANHDILLQKMFNIGIRNTELAWFSNYLKERLQYVYINNASST